jgi:dehydrodolichyl diphosphate syntase complex subunit NUS1
LVQSYLPEPPKVIDKWKDSKPRSPSRFGIRLFIRNQLYLLTFSVMHIVFSAYLRIRQVWHQVCYRIASVLFYHHRTPALIERDVKGLRKLPEHVSVILTSEEGERSGGDLERLINETADIATWCACAGIPMLSVYEKSGE